jgi:protein-S-isoprenylcysteine O-methyltransferase Ste14
VYPRRSTRATDGTRKGPRKLLAFAFMLPFLIWRLIDEEHLLKRDLRGYAEYQQRVRYRLVPGLW